MELMQELNKKNKVSVSLLAAKAALRRKINSESCCEILTDLD
jgi:hypothetical protein